MKAKVIVWDNEKRFEKDDVLEVASVSYGRYISYFYLILADESILEFYDYEIEVMH